MPQNANDHLENWYPAVRPPPPAETFEIGLVLAGAVSAGGYTAGVLDFLYEALDYWERAKLEDKRAGREGDDRTVPHHDVKIRIITGASAGGMNGAISAVALRYDYPRAWSTAKKTAVQNDGRFGAEWLANVDTDQNPFYLPWVSQIDISKLLGTQDLDDGVYSMLDCTSLEEITQSSLTYSSNTLTDKDVRKWLRNPLPLILTVTNLRGVPYRILFSGEDDSAHEMSLHQDHMAFAIPDLGPGAQETLAPDFEVLDPENTEQMGRLAETALASGAFPVGLRARKLTRRPTDYDDRHPIRISDEDGVLFDRPSWPNNTTPGSYDFLCVDGGVMNNEPFEIARRELAGLSGKNPRDGGKANRAVVMIDPFVEPGAPGPAEDAEVHNVFLSMIGAMKNQTRYSPRDHALIQNENVYSRFLVAPSRDNRDGALALASGGLSAFLGFFSEAYRHHDFMLGRRNCQRFLQTAFALPLHNPIFRHTWSTQARIDYPSHKDDAHFPLIPLVGPAGVEEPLPGWPSGAYVYGGDVPSLIKHRVNRIVEDVSNRITGKAKADTIWKKVTATGTSMYLSVFRSRA